MIIPPNKATGGLIQGVKQSKPQMTKTIFSLVKHAEMLKICSIVFECWYQTTLQRWGGYDGYLYRIK